MHVDYGARDFSQSDGIYNSYSTVARDLWQHKPPLSSGYALGLGSVYCHKSLAPCYNYNIFSALSGSSSQVPVTPIGGNQMYYALWE